MSEKSLQRSLPPRGLNQHGGRDSIKSKALSVNLEQRLEKVRKAERNGTPLLHFVQRFLPISSSYLLSSCEIYPVAALSVYSVICKNIVPRIHSLIRHLQ